MLRFIAKRYAKIRYQFAQLTEAASNDLNAGLALRQAAEKRTLAAQLTKEADEMDARIKKFSAMEEQGYWLCEAGHENDGPEPKSAGEVKVCFECVKNGVKQDGPDDPKRLMKFIKRDQMTGQEKYESDKERGEAEDVAKQKRDQAKAEEEAAAQSEKTAAYFRGLAENNRRVAEKVRRL